MASVKTFFCELNLLTNVTSDLKSLVVAKSKICMFFKVSEVLESVFNFFTFGKILLNSSYCNSY